MLMGYRFGFATFLTPPLPSYRGELNEMHGSATTLDHNFRDVITPNADTPYSMAGLDLRAEPMVLDVPAVADRYYVIQFVDLFGTNPHFVGSRATGPRRRLLPVGRPPDTPVTSRPGSPTSCASKPTSYSSSGGPQLFDAGDVEAVAATMARYGP